MFVNVKKKFIIDNEYIPNGSPCKGTDCGKLNTICTHCGRIKCRGNVQIEQRTGYVHLERLNSTYIKEHNKLSIEQQELNTIKLRFAQEF